MLFRGGSMTVNKFKYVCFSCIVFSFLLFLFREFLSDSQIVALGYWFINVLFGWLILDI